MNNYTYTLSANTQDSITVKGGKFIVGDQGITLNAAKLTKGTYAVIEDKNGILIPRRQVFLHCPNWWRV